MAIRALLQVFMPGAGDDINNKLEILQAIFSHQSLLQLCMKLNKSGHCFLPVNDKCLL